MHLCESEWPLSLNVFQAFNRLVKEPGASRSPEPPELEGHVHTLRGEGAAALAESSREDGAEFMPRFGGDVVGFFGELWHADRLGP